MYVTIEAAQPRHDQRNGPLLLVVLLCPHFASLAAVGALCWLGALVSVVRDLELRLSNQAGGAGIIDI